MATCRLRKVETALEYEDFHMVLASAPPTCAVRAAQPSDSNALASLATQLGYECKEVQVQQRLRGMMDPRQYGVFVAERAQGQVVGWVCVCVFRTVELDTFAEISGLVVDESLRSRGIGKTLLQAAEEWARRTGCVAIAVHSNVTRNRAHQFYLSNRYELVKTQKMFRKGLL